MQKNCSRSRTGFFLQVLLLLFSSCSTVSEKQPLILAELVPPEQTDEPVTEKAVQKEKPLPVVPLYVQGKVMEVEVVQGVQKFLYLKFNSDIVVGKIPEGDWNVSEERLINKPRSYTLRAGMTGEIYSDTRFTEKAGDFLLLEQYDDIYRAEIEGLNYIIDRSSLVQIQIR